MGPSYTGCAFSFPNEVGDPDTEMTIYIAVCLGGWVDPSIYTLGEMAIFDVLDYYPKKKG